MSFNFKPREEASSFLASLETLKGNTASRPICGTIEFRTYLDTTLDADGLPVFWNGTKWIKADGSDVVTADVAIALTTPTVGTGNTIAVGGAVKTGIVNVVNTTASVVLTGTKTSGQTVTIGGANSSLVTAAGTATDPTYTIDSTSVATTGGTLVFTLTVSEAIKDPIVYTVSIVVAGA